MGQVNQTTVFGRELKIFRSERRTVSLSVESGAVVVRAPCLMSDEEIFAFVRKHRDWLEKRLRRVGQTLDLADGSKIRIFGKEFSIRTGKAGFLGGHLFLPQDEREEALKKLLKSLTREQMGALTERIAQTCGLSYSGVRVSSARTRWGSCNKKGGISYSFRVALLPWAICQYIAVHELCHTVHFDHSKEFWSLVEKLLPDWKIRQKYLKESQVMSFL